MWGSTTLEAAVTSDQELVIITGIITNSEPETSEPKTSEFTHTSFPITFNAPTTPKDYTTSFGPTSVSLCSQVLWVRD